MTVGISLGEQFAGRIAKAWLNRAWALRDEPLS